MAASTVVRCLLALSILFAGCTTFQPIEGPDSDPARVQWDPEATYLFKLKDGRKLEARDVRREDGRLLVRVHRRSAERYRIQDMEWVEEAILDSTITSVEVKRANTGLTVTAIVIPTLVVAGLVGIALGIAAMGY